MKSIKTLIRDQSTVTVDSQMSVKDATRVMAAHRIGAVPVLDGERLVGIFTERDVMTRVVAADRDAGTTMVREVMSTNLVVAGIDEGYDVCLARMHQARVRHLIVLDQSRLGGIVSFRDLLAVDVDEKSQEIIQLNAYIHYIPADFRVADKP
jgi:CBS domain-containing protein